MDVEKQGMINNGFNYTLSPEDFMVSSIWSLPIHGRAALGGKISCATTIATSLKNTVVLLHGPIGCAYQRRINPCRGWNPIYDMPCTALSEAETVYGAYDRLLGAITEVYEKSLNITTLAQLPDEGQRSREFVSLVRDMGLHINGLYFYNNTVDDVKRLPHAFASVVQYATEPWTELLDKKYGMKYVELAPEPRYTSIEYGPYGFDGMDRLLMDIGEVYGIEGRAEEVAVQSRRIAEETLARHLPVLKGKTVSLVGSYTGGYAADLVRHCGMKCELLVLKFRTSTNFDMLLSEDAKKRTEEMWRDFCLKYGSDPDILVEPTQEEELKALKRTKPDLVVPSFASTPAWWYENNGFKTLVSNRLFGYFFRLGYWTVVDVAIEARRALEKTQSSKSLLAMLEYDDEYGGLTRYCIGLTVRECFDMCGMRRCEV